VSVFRYVVCLTCNLYNNYGDDNDDDGHDNDDDGNNNNNVNNNKQILCSWFRASRGYINKCPTRCNNMQSIF